MSAVGQVLVVERESVQETLVFPTLAVANLDQNLQYENLSRILEG